MRTLALLSILAVTGVGAYLGYGHLRAHQAHNTAARRTAEPNLAALGAAALGAYRRSSHGLGTLPPRFPPSASPTPALRGCKDKHPDIGPAPAAWQTPTWRALRFRLNEPHPFRYAFISNGVGQAARFTVRATGDLDCDGTMSTYERTGHVNARGEPVLDPEIRTTHPGE